jgi:chromosome partitioning protein
VLLIDGDEQGSAALFAASRAENGQTTAAFTMVQLQGVAIRQQVKLLRTKYDDIIIDAGGTDNGSLRAALTVADVLLSPFQPRSVDLWAAPKMGLLVAEVREVNEGLKAFSIINAADAQGQDNEAAARELQAVEGITYLPTVIVRRKAFPNAFSEGLSVVEHTPRDAKAIEELLSVVHTLYSQEIDNGNQDTHPLKAAG